VVDVMHCLIWLQRAPQHVSHHQPVFKHIAARISVGMARYMDMPIAIFLAAPATPSWMPRACARASARRLAGIRFVSAGTRAKHAAYDSARLAPHDLTTSNARVRLFHISMIAETA
jgi:hypothetical protein